MSDDDDLLILSQGPIRDLRDPAVVTSSQRVFEGRVWDIRRDEFTFAAQAARYQELFARLVPGGRHAAR